MGFYSLCHFHFLGDVFIYIWKHFLTSCKCPESRHGRPLGKWAQVVFVALWHFHCCQECSKYSGFVLKQRRTWCDFPFSSWGWLVFDQILSCDFYSVNHCRWFFCSSLYPSGGAVQFPLVGPPACSVSFVPFWCAEEKVFVWASSLIRLDNCSHLRHLTHPNNTCALPSCSVFILGFAFLLFFDSFLTGVCWWSCRLSCQEVCGDGAVLTSTWFGVKRSHVMHVARLSAALSPITWGVLIPCCFFNSLRCHTL